ncbi:MAG: helix-turn-helix transcriptional regulator [Bdellovibrionaceae bacterium]|nr:helix-turn-helix transcriptional regulator [Pseudobdellovibrionaceae bacterium]
MKTSPAESHLSEELRRFGERWKLTPREHDVLNLIALGTTRIKDVAARLQLSPNTVNNHVNSIFAKTQTRSKSELLTRVLIDLTTELIRYRGLVSEVLQEEREAVKAVIKNLAD